MENSKNASAGRKRPQNRRRQEEQRRRRTTILVITVVAALIIAAIVVVPPLIAANAPVGDIATAQSLARPQTNGLSMGNPNAPVKVVEYADFQCPYCKQFVEQGEPQLISQYVAPGKVYVTFMPFSFLGQESLDSAEAAYCANDQGKFWQYHDILYANQKGENQGDFTTSRLKAFAQTLGLDTTQFNQCLDSHKYKDQVQQDNTTAQQNGVSGTPSFAVNGKIVDANSVFATIDQDLATAQP
jgi:protein-disulfide isomerase